MTESGNSMPRVSDEHLDFDDDQVFYFEGRRFTGISFSDEPVRSEISYVNGLQNGPARDWYSSGGLMSETNYRDDVKHGEEREYFEDGLLKARRLYENGVLVSEVLQS
ncbi:hypothetical protein GCM10010123_38960 [Pilimelia anulata]|uniref:Uncharacterized protein n=1 Tax=Pilimelia anulata TaxID=53371 RepID=A0A8J3BI23_9ACTN|nr:hypothetical protein GCM10010123_38960 [Pilimelia anulata]